MLKVQKNNEKGLNSDINCHTAVLCFGRVKFDRKNEEIQPLVYVKIDGDPPQTRWDLILVC